MAFNNSDLDKETLSLYYKTLSDIVDSRAWLFKYSGSVASRDSVYDPYTPNITDAYKNVEMDSKDDLENLIRKGVMPRLLVGSRSQGLMSASTNYCITEYVEMGITNAKEILALVDNGITSAHLSKYIENNLEEAKKLTDIKDIINSVKQYYGDSFIPAKSVKMDWLVNFHWNVNKA